MFSVLWCEGLDYGLHPWPIGWWPRSRGLSMHVGSVVGVQGMGVGSGVGLVRCNLA